MGESSGRTSSFVLTMHSRFFASIALFVVVATLRTASAETQAAKCTDSCFGESCDFWVAQWGLSCNVVESEYGCECGGCACTQTVMDEAKRTFGVRRTGTGSGVAPTPNPTSPTGAPTMPPTLANEIKLTSTMNMAGVTKTQFNGIPVQNVFKTTVASGVSGADASDVVIITYDDARRSGLSVTFDVYLSTTDAATADSAKTALTTFLQETGSNGFAQTFNTAASNANVAVTVTGVSGVTTSTAPVVTPSPTASPTAAPTPTVIDSAPISCGVSTVAAAAVAIVLAQLGN